jgi:NAD(P)-dependent dehydrogenase (short-subunit alcohol dehydrogenase family)
MADRITSPFGAFTPAAEVTAGKDLTGLSVIVTGGATGIGIETARALASAGATVTLAVRNLEAGRVAADSIGGRPPVEVEALDLTSLASVRAFAERWGDRPLHVLINNAGVMACPLAYTSDDLEMQVGTNHFGHFLLAVLLTPALRRAADERGRASRVVSLSSIGHVRSGVNFEDIHFRSRPYDKWESYGQSKSANSLFAVDYDRRFAGEGVRANAVMPGGIMTPLQRHLPIEEQRAMGWIDENGKVNDRFKTPEQGASTSVWAAVGDELEGVGGLYLENCAQAVAWSPENRVVGVRAEHALDPQSAERLWTVSEKTVGLR